MTGIIYCVIILPITGVHKMSELNTVNPARYKRSRQRQKILSLLQEVNNHPTAEWIYSYLKPGLNSLSMGTVYRNLRILEEQELIRRMCNGSGVDRFDAKMEPHSHFICRHCGEIEDLDVGPLTGLIREMEVMTGHLIEAQRLDFLGICSKCRTQKWH